MRNNFFPMEKVEKGDESSTLKNALNLVKHILLYKGLYFFIDL